MRTPHRGLSMLATVVLLALGSLFALTQPASAAEPGADDQIELVLFWGDGCPHCEAERNWLEDVRKQYPQVTVTEYEVWHDDANRALMQKRARELGFEASGVPTTIIGEQHWVGFSGPVRAQIEGTIIALAEGQDPAETGSAAVIEVPFLGEFSLDDSSLVVSTLVIGFVDGVNPCSLWVISVLLTIVVRTGSRRRVFAIGSTFLLVTAGMYALYMAGIYSAMSVIGHLDAIQVAVAVIAGIFGIVSVKDYFAFKKGISFSIRDSSKPGIYRRMRNAAGHHNLLPALAATVALAVGVSLMETPCTAGFPVLWTGLLAANDVGAAEAMALFVVYMVPFLVDEMIVFGIAVVTLRSSKLQERHGRLLKLVAGTTMLALAGTLLVRPETMNSPLGALFVFAAAFVVAALIHLVANPWIEAREVAAHQHTVVGHDPSPARSTPPE